MCDKIGVKCTKLVQDKVLSWLRRYTSCDIGERIVGMIRKQETGDQVQKGFGSDEVTYRSM